MRSIYAIGETVYDIIFKNGEPVTAKAGGTMLNTSVSLGRLGLPVFFLSEYAADGVGDIIDGFLKENAVDTTLLYRYQNGKTPIALAFLNEQNDARYSFYKQYPEKRLEIDMPDFRKGDILLFGGFYSLMKEVRHALITFVRAARDAGVTILYDPNIRSPHKDEIENLRDLVYENLGLAHIIRGSDEDFDTIFDIKAGADAYTLVQQYGGQYLIYTNSNVGVEIYSPRGKLELEVPEVKTLSTIGAGDSFNAGLIYELYRSERTLPDMTLAELGNIVKTAIAFGSHVCTHYENYVSKDFARALK